MAVAVSVGVQMDVQDARRNAAMFARAVGDARVATQGLTDTLKVFRASTADLNLTAQQSAAAEARVALAHEKRTAKIHAEIAALEQLKSASGWMAGVQNIGGYSKSGSQAWSEGLAQMKANAAAKSEAGASYMTQFDTTQERVNRQLAEAKNLLTAGVITQEQYSKATASLSRQNNLAYRSFEQLRSAATSFVGPIALAVGAYQAFIGSIKAAADLDVARAKFKVFTGSIREAEQMLSQLRDLSSSSPVSFTGAQRATATMLQFGVDDTDVVRNLRQIAEITGGNTERMESLSLAFGQASAAGRLMGQELLQMVNAGFNPLKVISDQTGRSMKDLKDAMAAGEISFEMVADAFEDATSAGGQFNGLLNEIADTTAGKITKARSEIEQLAIAFGELVKPQTDLALDNFSASSQAMRTLLSPSKLYNTAVGGMYGDEASAEAQKQYAEYVLLTRNFQDANFGISGITDEQVKAAKDYLATLRAIQEGSDLPSGVDEAAANKIRQQFEQETRQRENLPAEQAQAAYEEYQQLAEATKDVNEQHELWVKHVEKVGQGFITDAGIEEYKRYKEEIEAANKALKEQERIRGTFSEGIGDAQGDLRKSRYGERADIVKLDQEQATGDERRIINNMIAAGAAYDDIILAANDEAQAQVAILETLLEKNKAIEDGKAKEKEAAKVAADSSKERARELEDARKQYESDQRELENQAKSIRDMQNPLADLIDKLATATLLRDRGLITDDQLKAERNRLAGDAVKTINATAAPSFSRGSQEAYQFVTGQTVDKITKQIQEAEKQTLLAHTAIRVAEETNRKLDELIDGKPQVMGP